MSLLYRKTQRILTPFRKYAWLFIPLVAVGGLWYPHLGLLMIPVMLSLAVMGFIRGKYWCGNFCPHGSLFDGILMRFSANRKIPRILRAKIIKAIAFCWFAFMLSNRLLTVFAGWGSLGFYERLGYIFVMNYLVVTVVGTILAVFVSPRAWCVFCPMGTFQVLMYRLGRALNRNYRTDIMLRLTQPQDCRECGLCASVCPMQLEPYIDADDSGRFKDGDCIRCGVCAENCPPGLLQQETFDERTDRAGGAQRRKAG